MTSYGEFEGKLFIGIYRDEENGAVHGSKLMDVCRNEKLPLDEHFQQRFVNQNQAMGDSSGFSGGHLCFALNSDGRSKAVALIEQNNLRTWRGKFSNIQRSDWIAIFAALISLIALLK